MPVKEVGGQYLNYFFMQFQKKLVGHDKVTSFSLRIPTRNKALLENYLYTRNYLVYKAFENIQYYSKV